MKNKKTTHGYSVMADITLRGVVVEVAAESLDDALEKAKNLTVADFVEILGDHNDTELEIQGFWK